MDLLLAMLFKPQEVSLPPKHADYKRDKKVALVFQKVAIMQRSV